MPPMMSGAPSPEEKKYTPEEKAKLQESRALSDADLIRGGIFGRGGGATFIPDLNGEPVLSPTEEQKLDMVAQQAVDEKELMWKNSPDSLLETKKMSDIFDVIVKGYIDDQRRHLEVLRTQTLYREQNNGASLPDPDNHYEKARALEECRKLASTFVEGDLEKDYDTNMPYRPVRKSLQLYDKYGNPLFYTPEQDIKNRETWQVSGRPYIQITNDFKNEGVNAGKKENYTKCYSFDEFISKLSPDELEAGEKFVKKLQELNELFSK